MPGPSCPALAWTGTYRRAWLGHDVFAGIVLTRDPRPGRDGLRRGVRPACDRRAVRHDRAAARLRGARAVPGSSSSGPDSALLPLIAAVVVPLSAGSQDRAIAIGALLALVVGVVIIAAGVARLGFLTDLLSAPVRHGYLNGIALIVFVSQLPRLFGFSTAAATGLFDEVSSFATGLQSGQTNTVVARHRRRLPGGHPWAACLCVRAFPGSSSPWWGRRS